MYIDLVYRVVKNEGGRMMINEVNRKINQLNKKVGSQIRVPELTKRRMNQSALTNLVVGGFIASAGIIFERKELFFLGGLGLVGSLVMSIEASNIKSDEE